MAYTASCASVPRNGPATEVQMEAGRGPPVNRSVGVRGHPLVVNVTDVLRFFLPYLFAFRSHVEFVEIPEGRWKRVLAARCMTAWMLLILLMEWRLGMGE